MLKDGKIYVPENCGKSMDADCIPEKPFELKIKYFIKNSFGFGGNNVSFLVKNLLIGDNK
jgi:3-oxoacyl-(acyl-carrier-protein) synthase